MVHLICGWCGKGFYSTIKKDRRDERNILKCPHCARLLPSSKKVSTGKVVGRTHTHVDYKDGDIAG